MDNTDFSDYQAELAEAEQAALAEFARVNGLLRAHAAREKARAHAGLVADVDAKMAHVRAQEMGVGVGSVVARTWGPEAEEAQQAARENTRRVLGLDL